MPRHERQQLSRIGRDVYKAIVAQGRSLFPVVLPPALRQEAESDEAASQLLIRRDAERYAQSVAVATEAASQFAPTIPVVDGFASARGALVHLASTIAKRPRDYERRLSAAARQAGNELFDCLPVFAQNALPDLGGTVKAFSDDPVELMKCGPAPLAMMHPVVRVPVTPGTVLRDLLTPADPIILSPSDFRELLLLRGTERTDRTYDVIESLCSQIVKSVPEVRLRTVDVRSLDDIVRACAEFDGALAIFDAHGIHPDRQSGYLRIGTNLVNFAGTRVKLPPIVILAACDTHAINRRQDTLAASVLHAGARTVVGTLAEVGGREAGGICGSAIFHITNTIPHLPGPIRWSELFAIALWENHARQAVSAMVANNVFTLTEEQWRETLKRILDAVRDFGRPWRASVVRSLAGITKVPIETIDQAWQEFAYLTDATLYTQLGHADTLFLAPTSESETHNEFGLPRRPL